MGYIMAYNNLHNRLDAALWKGIVMFAKLSLRRHHLIVLAWVGAALLLFAACGQAAPTPSPEQAAKLAALCAATDAVRCYPAPNGQWMVKLDLTAGNAQLLSPAGAAQPLLQGSGQIAEASWSPDSRQLVWVQQMAQNAGQNAGQDLAQMWRIRFDEQAGGQTGQFQPGEAKLVFPTQTFGMVEAASNLGGGVRLGDWSPNSRYLLFWIDPMFSASLLADGAPVAALDTLTGDIHSVTTGDQVALFNQGYHSWAPDSSHLVITLGGDRSALGGKSLALHRLGTDGSSEIITPTLQVPGMVAWSPKGDLIAYAAIPGEDAAPPGSSDQGLFDNPAIAARRIYLLDPQNGKRGLLDPNASSFQDAPVWSHNGSLVYYIQREGDQMVVMVADLYAGAYSKLPDASMPISDVQSYYGQFDWSPLLSKIKP